MGRPAQPAELASICVQLGADDASIATGNIYRAGGGKGQPRAAPEARWVGLICRPAAVVAFNLLSVTREVPVRHTAARAQ